MDSYAATNETPIGPLRWRPVRQARKPSQRHGNGPAIGKIDDVRRAVTLEAKAAGDLVYVIGQTRAELTVEIMGHSGLGWEGEGFTSEEINTVRAWLGGKAMSIYGGSFEIQNNIISKRILGLPDTTQSS